MPGGSRLRPSVLAARQQLADGRRQLREQHNRGLDGARVCARFTSLVDATIRQLYEAYLAELPSGDADKLRERVALVAHGGYGRRQQAPYSDVDVMILYDGKLDEPIKQLASRMWQDISDINLALGHSLRGPDEAVKLARSDPQIGTSLLESRLMLGNSHGVRPVQQGDGDDGAEERLVACAGRSSPSGGKSGWNTARRFTCWSRMSSDRGAGCATSTCCAGCGTSRRAWAIRIGCTTWACSRSSIIAG